MKLFIQKIIKRPAVLFCLSLISGILAVDMTGSAIMALLMLLPPALCIYLFRDVIKGQILILFLAMLFYAAGVLEFSALDGRSTGKYADFDGKVVTVTGFVVSEPDIKDTKVSYIISADDIRTSEKVSSERGKVLLSTEDNKGSRLLGYGERLRFTGRLYKPAGVRNPGGFDYRRYLARKGVSATIFAVQDNISQQSGEKASFFYNMGNAVRRNIIGIMDKSLPGQQAGLLEGILIGYRGGISEDVKDAFSDAGLTHIMAVSGANVAFLILPLAWLFRRLKLKRSLSGVLTIVFLLFFVFVTGLEPSVLRAVIMAVVVLAGKVLLKDSDVFTSISVSAIAIIIYSPYMLFDVGFLLTYAATLSLVLFYKNIKKLITCRYVPAKLADVIAVTLAAQVGVLPVIMLYFNKVSLISVFSNLLVVPILEAVTILGMLMAVAGQAGIIFSQLIGYINNVLLSFILLVTKISSGLPFSTVRMATPSVFFVVLYYLTAWSLLGGVPGKAVKNRLRFAAVGAAAILVITLAGQIIPDKLEVVFLDVGEGDSAFIRTSQGKTVLLDGGGSANPGLVSGVGESVVIPFLLDSGVTCLDAVIATHGHSDHIQGLQSVMEYMKVKNLVISEPENGPEFSRLLQDAALSGAKVTRCSQGDVLRLDRYTAIDVLYPIKKPSVNSLSGSSPSMSVNAASFANPYFSEESSSLNDLSLVLKLRYKDTDILFTGDMEKESEQELLGSLDGDTALEADVVKIAHHGSNTSTGADFLSAVDPKAAVISVGRNNFGHPSPATLDLLEENGIRVFRTDECGAVVLRSNGRKIWITRTIH